MKQAKAPTEGSNNEIEQLVKNKIDCPSPKFWIPLPQGLKDNQDDKPSVKILEIFKKLYINISFVEAITQMPNILIFLKEILDNKRNLTDFETVTLNEECSSYQRNYLLSLKT